MAWRQLLDEYKLGNYADKLERDGYDDPVDWKDIMDQDLLEMGFKKGHMKKWKRMVASLGGAGVTNQVDTTPQPAKSAPPPTQPEVCEQKSGPPPATAQPARRKPEGSREATPDAAGSAAREITNNPVHQQTVDRG